MSRVNGATDDDGVIRVVPTAEYEAKKGRGIAAPCPGEEGIHIWHDSWKQDETLFWRESDDDEWAELERPVEGDVFLVRPGESIRLDSPPSIRITM